MRYLYFLILTSCAHASYKMDDRCVLPQIDTADDLSFTQSDMERLDDFHAGCARRFGQGKCASWVKKVRDQGYLVKCK